MSADRDRALFAWVEDEQKSLWHELYQAIDQAINGAWSIAAANVAVRIVGAARLVGPSHPHGVPWPLVQGGVYQAILTAADLPLHPILSDASEMARTDEMMAKYSEYTRAGHLARYAATVQAIQTPRETAFIRDGDE